MKDRPSGPDTQDTPSRPSRSLVAGVGFEPTSGGAAPPGGGRPQVPPVAG